MATDRLDGNMNLIRTMPQRSVYCALIALAFPPALSAQTLPRATPESVGLSSGHLAQIKPRLQQLFVDSAQAPGFVVAIARHSKLVYLDTIGHSDVSKGQPMRSNTVFRAFSLTKPVTTVAVLQLVEQGKIGLQDPASKYVPALKGLVVRGSTAADSAARTPLERPITIHDLLTHTAGFAYAPERNTMLSSPTIADFTERVVAIPLLSQPGTAWRYGVSIDVLGRIVEVASGNTFDRYLQDAIFAPLGMRETGFHVSPQTINRLVPQYVLRDGRLVAPAEAVAPNYQPESRLFMGGEGLLSTVPDYLRFGQMLLNGGALDGHRILKRETVAMMLANHVDPSSFAAVSDVSHGWLPNGTYGFGYGGAVRVDSAANAAPPGTYGWAGFAATFFWIDPRNDLVALIWTQCTSCRKQRFSGELERIVYGAFVR